MQLTAKMVEHVLSEDADPWRIGNHVLYDLCSRYPTHKDAAEIVAKIWLIGRAYAASVERGRGKVAGTKLSNGQFYTETVSDALRKSQLDHKLDALASFDELNEANAGSILDAHAYLVRVFKELTPLKKPLNKRSLASKYLHFHRPKLFFIYDSRAASSIQRLQIPCHVIQAPQEVDESYARFVSAALDLREQVFSEFGQRLNPRQIDRLLLAIHEDIYDALRVGSAA